jgi:magnesium-transporting ATPase (P-type)
MDPKPSEKEETLNDYRNVYLGFSQAEIIEDLRSRYERDDNPNDKLILPKLKNNRVSTSKYNVVNFLPKAILIQFFRIYNFYFLFTVILQGIPEVSTQPVYLAALPFVFVIGISVVRELIEEIKRRRQDKKVNNTPVKVLSGNKFHECKWSELKVGDVLLIHEDETFPADLLLIQCSDNYGTAYIQTMTLDGERALKSRQAYTEVADRMAKKSMGPSKLKLHLKCEKPNNKIYQFEGQLTYENPSLPMVKATLDQFMLRGSVLSNTDWVIGMVVYAGHDTKIMKNMGKSKYKQTHIEKRLNNVVVFLIIFQVFLCILLAILATEYIERNEVKTTDDGSLEGPTYLFTNTGDSDRSAIVNLMLSFLQFFLLLSSILPISLLVSLEIIKIAQALFIIADAQMYSVEIDQSCKVMTMSLNEELGMINNIFTDKTGTLTSNEMVFKAC